MAYNEELVNRVRETIAQTRDDLTEKKMFGGICILVDDKMLGGVINDRLMLRIDPSIQEELLEKDGCSLMDFTGKPMKGYVYVDMEVLQSSRQLEYWINRALEFNKTAKVSKKKKT
jgi:TfoX/Sxy family transcriptional regulator of competence genes